MRAISPCRLAVVFAGLLWAAAMACAGPAQTPTSTSPDAPAQNIRKKKPDPSGVWHHFGEPDSASVAAGQNDQRTGSRFDTNRAARSVSPQPSRTKRMANLARQMRKLVNRDRQDPANAAETRGRAQPLRWNDKLAAVALAHSRDMLEHHYFDHVDREGRNPFVRINATGIHWRALAENIAINRTVADAEASLMDEPRFQENHRGNILNPVYTDVGIGIVQAPNGDLYITQDFAAIPHRHGAAGSR
ncbi:MAG: CAP domain-containing protein [Acidobacteriota bacterium]